MCLDSRVSLFVNKNINQHPTPEKNSNVNYQTTGLSHYEAIKRIFECILFHRRANFCFTSFNVHNKFGFKIKILNTVLDAFKPVR